MFKTLGIGAQAAKEAQLSGQIMCDAIVEHLPFERLVSNSRFTELGNGLDRLLLVHLDGSEGYVYGQPNYSLGIAYLREGEVHLSGVFNPFYKELFFAEAGKGLKRNNFRAEVNEVALLDESFLGFSFRGEYTDKGQIQLTRMFQLMRQPVRSMIPGSDLYGLSLLANGNLAGLVIASPDVNRLLPGLFIVEAAGGKITDENGDSLTSSSEFVIATNGRIHDALLAQFESKMTI